MIVAMIGLSMPNFWLGLLLIIVFSLNLGWFPSGGDQTPVLHRTSGNYHRNRAHGYLDENDPFFYAGCFKTGVFTNRKGQRESRKKIVITSHALRNALIPIITIIGTQLAGVLGGSVLTETVFAWPGVGRLIVDSLNMRGYSAGYRQHYYDNNSP